MSELSRRSFTKNAILAAGAAVAAGTTLGANEAHAAFGSFGKTDTTTAETTEAAATTSDVNYKQLFMDEMDAEGVKYTDFDTWVVKVQYQGDNMDDITVFVVFDDDGSHYVGFRIWSIYMYDEQQLADAYRVCNERNYQYRWGCFYVDSDNEVGMKHDTILDPASAGAETLELVKRLVRITDESYPSFEAIGY